MYANCLNAVQLEDRDERKGGQKKRKIGRENESGTSTAFPPVFLSVRRRSQTNVKRRRLRGEQRTWLQRAQRRERDEERLFFFFLPFRLIETYKRHGCQPCAHTVQHLVSELIIDAESKEEATKSNRRRRKITVSLSLSLSLSLSPSLSPLPLSDTD